MPKIFLIVEFVYLGPNPDNIPPDHGHTVQAVLEEQKPRKPLPQSVPISGPELAAMMKVGTRVVRGLDWKWADQVGTAILLSYIFKLQMVIDFC